MNVIFSDKKVSLNAFLPTCNLLYQKKIIPVGSACVNTLIWKPETILRKLFSICRLVTTWKIRCLWHRGNHKMHLEHLKKTLIAGMAHYPPRTQYTWHCPLSPHPHHLDLIQGFTNYFRTPYSLSVFPPGGLGQQDFRARSARKRRRRRRFRKFKRFFENCHLKMQ